METVLVTGGNGFIGQYVSEELVRRGYKVHILDTRYRQPVDGTTVVLGDIRDATAVTEAAAHADGIIHLAGVLGTQETIRNPRPAAETNILGGLNVLEAAVQYHLPMVNIAVGNYWMGNTYAITKNTIERFVEMFNKDRGGRITTVRGLNAYGPRQSVAAPYGPSKVRKIMPSFICRALMGQPIEVYGDGEQVMDMIYVTDIANVLVTALEKTADIGPMPTIEAGTGRSTTVNDIAEVVVNEVKVITGHATVINHLPMRPGEQDRSVVIGHPETLEPLGIRAEGFVALNEGVQRSVDYFMRYLGITADVA